MKHQYLPKIVIKTYLNKKYCDWTTKNKVLDIWKFAPRV